MARKKDVGKAALLAAGLGTAALAHKMRDPDFRIGSDKQYLEDILQGRRDDLVAQRMRELNAGINAERADAAEARMYANVPNIARSSTGQPILTAEGVLGTQYKKGGAVKGWGKARGARKAKVY
jgi:hypothetical protein